MNSKLQKSKRVAIYVRVSTADKQDCAMQLADLTEYAKARGWEVAETYEDKGFSGKNTNRPKLKQMLLGANARKFDIVLVWKLDRFARSLGDLIGMIQNLSEVGVEFVSLKDNLDLSTSQGRLLLHLLGAFAQFERDIIVSRVRAGLEHAKARGQRLGRPQVRNDEAIRLMRAKGLSLRQIAKRLGVSKSSVQNSLAGVQKTPA